MNTVLTAVRTATQRNPVALLTGAVPIILMALSEIFEAEIAPDAAGRIVLGIGAAASVLGSVAAARRVQRRDRSTVVVISGLIPAAIALYNLLASHYNPDAVLIPADAAGQLQLVVQAVAAGFTRGRVTPAVGVTDSAAAPVVVEVQTTRQPPSDVDSSQVA